MVVVLFVLDDLAATSVSAALRVATCCNLVSGHESIAALGTPASRWSVLVEKGEDTEDPDCVDEQLARNQVANRFHHAVVSEMLKCHTSGQQLLVLLNNRSHSASFARRRLASNVRSRFQAYATGCTPLLGLIHVSWPTAVHTLYEAWWKPWLYARDALTTRCTLDEAEAALWSASNAVLLCEPVTADEGWTIARCIQCDPCDTLKDVLMRACLGPSQTRKRSRASNLVVFDLCSAVAHGLACSAHAESSESGSSVFALATSLLTVALHAEANATLVVLAPRLETDERSSASAPLERTIAGLLTALRSAGVHYYVASFSPPPGLKIPGCDSNSSRDGADLAARFAALYDMELALPMLSSTLVHGLALALSEEHSRTPGSDVDFESLQWLASQWYWLMDSHDNTRCPTTVDPAHTSPLFTVESWHHHREPRRAWSEPAPAVPGTNVPVPHAVLQRWCATEESAPMSWTKAGCNCTLPQDQVCRVVSGPVEICFSLFGSAPRGKTSTAEVRPTQTPLLLLGACLRAVSMQRFESGRDWLSSQEGREYEPFYRTYTSADNDHLLHLVHVGLTHRDQTRQSATDVLLCCGTIAHAQCELCEVTVGTACTHIAALLYVCTTCRFASTTASSSRDGSDRTHFATPPMGVHQAAGSTHISTEPSGSCVANGLPAFMVPGVKRPRATSARPRPAKPAKSHKACAVTVRSGNRISEPKPDDAPEKEADTRDTAKGSAQLSLNANKTHGVRGSEAPSTPPEVRFAAINDEWRVNSQNVWQCEWDEPSLPHDTQSDNPA